MRLLIKIGGTLLDDVDSRDSLARQIADARHAGHTIVVVHGGGRQLTRYLEERGVESRFVNGLRVTGDPAIDAVVKILAGTVNKQLVGSLRARGVSAVGLTGLDGGLTQTSRLSEELGWVGRVESVDPALLDLLTQAGYMPVLACVGGDDSGSVWNINADRMAVACAQSFRVDRLLFLTDVAGVIDRKQAVVPSLDPRQVRDLIENGIARGGMQAKLEAAVCALSGGVGSVVIAPGADPRILERLLRGDQVGTILVNG